MKMPEQFSALITLAGSVEAMLALALVISAGCTSTGRHTHSDAVDYFNSGLQKRQHHDYDGANADFTKAIEFKADYADAYIERGIAKISKGDLDDAIGDFTKAIEINPNDASAYEWRSVVKSAENIEDLGKADSIKANQIRGATTRRFFRQHP